MTGGTLNPARVAWVFAAALAVFVAWISTDVSANAGIAFFYAVPVGMATWWGGWRAGAAAVVGCASLYAVGSLIQPVSHFGTAFAMRLAAFAAVVVLVSLLRERILSLEHSAEELEAIRASLAPATLPDLPDVDAATAFVPSEYGVSGDFYLLTNGPDGSTVAVVGDVSGHGPKAARLATFLRARFAALAASVSDPAEMLTLVNRALLDRPRREQLLVSAVCLRLGGSRLSWAIAGHPPPLQLPELDELSLAGETFLLGARADFELGNAEVVLREGSGVAIYTDGATDVRRQGALLGLDGLCRLLAPLTGLGARAMATRAEAAILEWADEPIRDDLCLLVHRPKPGPG